MEIITINVLASETGFGETLGEVITRNHKNMLVNVYKKGERPLPCDLTISDYKKTGSRLIRLTDKFSEVNKEEHILYKFGNIKELVSHIVFAYSKFTGRKLISSMKNKVKIFGVMSSFGGAGCTITALGIAQELKRFNNKKVLYLSLEDFESTNMYFDTTVSRKTIKEYLYYLCNYNSNLCSAITEYLLCDEYGVEAFMPSVGINSILELKENDFIDFINGIIEGGRYDVIIIDGGNKLNNIHGEAYGICDNLILLENRNCEKGKYYTYLKHLCGEAIEENIIRVRNKYEPAEEDEYVGLYLPEDMECFQEEDNIKSIMLDSSFGIGVRKIIKNLT